MATQIIISISIDYPLQTSADVALMPHRGNYERRKYTHWIAHHLFLRLSKILLLFRADRPTSSLK